MYGKRMRGRKSTPRFRKRKTGAASKQDARVAGYSGRPTHESVVGGEAFTADSIRRMMPASRSGRPLNDVRCMLNVSVDCIKLIDGDGTVLHMNRAGCVALGVPEGEERFGMKWLDLLAPEVRKRGRSALARARKGLKAKFAGMSVRPGLEPRYWDNILTPIRDADGNVSRILCVSRDVTRQREAEHRLRLASEIDDLTGLLKRKAFNARLKQSLALAREGGWLVGLMIVDLDHFKNVNDTLGHAAGDHLLRACSARLGSVLGRHPGLAARLGGDEFAIAVDRVHTRQEIGVVARQVARQMGTPVVYGGKVINFGLSIGWVVFPRDAGEITDLMKRADMALHELKVHGRGGVRMFDRHLLAIAERAATQLDRARQVVRDGSVSALYCPVVRLTDRRIVGLDTLLCWHLPGVRGRGAAGEIMEAFNDYELATGIAGLMQEKVFSDIARWLARGLDPVPVSIHAAPVEFLRDDFAEVLLERMDRFRIPKWMVGINVDERVLVERGTEYAFRALRLLKDEGLRIALDDFGTGQSFFVRVPDYPVDCLKMEQSLIGRMDAEPPIHAIIEAMAKLGSSLCIDVVAKGVETTAQMRAVKRAGCTMGRGPLFGKLLGSRAAATLLASRQRPARKAAARRRNAPTGA